MRNAPPVVYPVGRSVWAVRLAVGCACGLGALVCLLAWSLQMDVPGLGLLVGVSATVAWLVGLLVPRELMPPGALEWDGETWWFSDDARLRQAVKVEILWDAGRCMLLRISMPSQAWPLARYACLHASSLPLNWHGLRCAVHSAGDF